MPKKTVLEPESRAKVIGDYDVVVCGGGPAGCAAAMNAARHGARTLIVEKDGHLGGQASSGLVCVILSTNGVDFQGIWHEWARELHKLGGIQGGQGGDSRKESHRHDRRRDGLGCHGGRLGAGRRDP